MTLTISMVKSGNGRRVAAGGGGEAVDRESV